MSIKDFYTIFISQEERGRLFEVLRRVSRLQPGALLAVIPSGWPEWPQISPEDPWMETV